MSYQQADLVMMAREHWKTYLPKMWKELVETGNDVVAPHEAAKKAREKIRMLMNQGLKDYEAREIVLPELILLPPESETTGSEELDEEIREREMDF